MRRPPHCVIHIDLDLETVVPNPAAQPVTIALNNLSGTFSVEWNVVMAGAVVAALPTAIIYILLGRFFIRGILAGSVKG